MERETNKQQKNHYIARRLLSVLAFFMPFSCGIGAHALQEEGFFIITRLRRSKQRRKRFMEFFNSAVGVLQTLVIALGAGLGIWGAINLLEGYGNDNPGANAHVR